MYHTCTLILVGVVFTVSEIMVLSKTANFPFRTMDYSPWSSENVIDRNRLKKIMHVGIDVTYMYTDFGGVTSPVSEILVLSKTAKFLFRSIVIKKFNQSELAQKIHACRD